MRNVFGNQLSIEVRLFYLFNVYASRYSVYSFDTNLKLLSTLATTTNYHTGFRGGAQQMIQWRILSFPLRAVSIAWDPLIDSPGSSL